MKSTRDIALELLNTLKARHEMYCITREAVLMRATTILDMLGLAYSASDFCMGLTPPIRGWTATLQYFKGSPDKEWVAKVVDDALRLMPPE